ncbi:MAG: Ubiquitin-like protein pup [Mycobacterium sp.]|jgi:ubiquitin-like protein Pup|nr:Ubiquitin-like protein pup [Mycobacterium sp.]
MASTEGGGQQRGSRRRDEADEVAVDAEAQDEVKERHEKLSDDVDSLLDEIDGVLEENAEEFVRGYIQKGGQ